MMPNQEKTHSSIKHRVLNIKILKMSFFIDVQGFQFGSNTFLCKEVAILNNQNELISHRFVKLPIPIEHYTDHIKRHMSDVTYHIHGLKWENDDCLQYEQLSEYIRECIGSTDATIFVKGLEKKKWLEKIIPNEVTDIYSIGCPSLEILKTFMKSNHCKKHLCNNNLSCAIENAFYIWYWYTHCYSKK